MRIKIVNLILCVSLIFSLLVGFNVHAQTENTDYGAKAFEFLQALGMLDSDNIYEPDLQVDRGLFAKLAVDFSGNTINSEDVSDFKDIENSEYKQYIVSAYKQGYIAGVDNTHFSPDTAVTYEQAVKILMTILGYDPAAQEMGGYPSGYMKVAEECKLLKNTSPSDNLNMRDALILLYNAAHTDVMELKSIGTSYTYVINEGETFLVKNFGIYICEGVINATAYTDLLAQESELDRNKVSIGNLSFDVNDTDAENYLGYYVKLYYDASDMKTDYKTIYVDVNNKKSTYVSFKDMQNVEVDGNTVKYYDDSSKPQKMRVSSTASFIKNGKLSAMSINDLENIEKGCIELISNDGDNIADVVRVTVYETYVVSSVSEEAGIITTQDNQRITIDKIGNESDFSILRNGENISLSEIAPEDVILISQSEGKGRNLQIILVGVDSVQGVVSKKNADEITIDKQIFKVDKNTIETISVGKTYFCKLDALGYIAYVRPENDFVYGFVYKIWQEENDKLGMRIFTENDRWVDIGFNDKVKLNGKRVKKEIAYETIHENLNDIWSRMIRYTVDENANLKTIEIAQSIDTGAFDEARAIDEDIFRKTVSGNAQYKNGAKSFGGKFFADSLTKIFSIPSDLDKDKFEMCSLSDFTNEKSYNMIAYDTDKYLTAKAMIVLDNKKSIGSSSKMMIVSGTGGITLNEDDEPVPMLEGFWKGDLVSLPVKIGDSYVSQSVYDELEKGDVIQFTYDNYGNVINIMRHVRDDYGNYSSSAITLSYTVIGGTVNHCNSNSINLSYTENGTRAGIALNSSTVIYLYDKQDNLYKACDWSEILEGDKIMAVLSHLVCKEVVIIRE